MLTVHGMIEHYTSLHPNHIAVLDRNQTYTYDDINQKANALANYLQTLRVPRESIIALAIDRSADLLISMIAVLKTGCAYLPLDATHPTERLQFQLKDAAPPIIITHSSYKEKFAGYTGIIVLIDEIGKNFNSDYLSNPSHDINSSNLAYVIYTSGSTGTPKGVLVEHRSIVNYIQWLNHYLQCPKQSRIDFSSSVVFDMAVTSSLAALASGLQVSICSDDIKKDVSAYLDYLANNRINYLKITPSYFKTLIDIAANRNIKLPELHAIILGGEQLHTRDCGNWIKHYPHQVIHNEYGPTEATVAVTQFKVTNDNINKLGTVVPIGKPGPNITCHLETTTDELLISGDCLARGYLNQEQLTAERFSNNSYKTGDICRILPDNNIEFIKRIDNQVKIRGYRIELGEIETCLLSHPAIKDATVITRLNPVGDQQIIAYYIPSSDSDTHKSLDLRQYLQQRLPDYMIPFSFIKLSTLPLNGNGKIDVHALPMPSVNSNVVNAHNDIQKELITIWQRIFNIKNIGIECNFFDLGGHSLLAARLINAIEKQFHVKMTLRQLYSTKNITELAVIIEQLKQYSSDSAQSNKHIKVSSVLADQTKNIPLSDFQLVLWLASLFEPKIKKLNIVIRKRLSGKIDKKAFESALKSITKKHEILNCHPKRFFPEQYYYPNINLQINEINITNSSESNNEKMLAESYQKLTDRKSWSLGREPWIIANLFSMKNNHTELQLSIPHIIFDDSSIDVLLDQLNHAYHHYKNDSPYSSTPIAQFKDYINEEKEIMNLTLNDNINFWKKYLHAANLLTISDKHIIKRMRNKKYSSSFKLPANIMDDLRSTCSHASLSITDLICAAVTLSLKKANNGSQGKICGNIVRTVRDNEQYVDTIGCFLRLDPVLIDTETTLKLIPLAKQIQQSRIETEDYQNCPSFVKMACLNKRTVTKNPINLLIKSLAYIYCKLFPHLQLNSTVLKMYTELTHVRSKHQFVVNINLFNNVLKPAIEKTFFGLDLVNVINPQYDLSKINNVLDISLLRNDNHLDLVVSANLTESYRKQIGEEIIHILTTAQTT